MATPQWLTRLLNKLNALKLPPVTPINSAPRAKKSSYPLSWGQSFTTPQIHRLLKLARDFNWKPDQLNYLMACMAFETGGSFDPRCKNLAGSGATGLIQFMPKTAIGLGTTVDDLMCMTRIQQLDYVEKYFEHYHKRTKTLSDMYMAILLPKFIGKPEDDVLFADGTVAYRQNLGLDINKDSIITKAEATAKVKEYYIRGCQPANTIHVDIAAGEICSKL